MKKILIIIKLVSVMLIVLFVHISSVRAKQIIYSVDTDSDHLVQVDPKSGDITDIGYLGFDVIRTIDLATLNGKLYGLHSDPWNSVFLHEINPVTGTSTSTIQLFINNDPTDPMLHAEGLTSIDEQLKIAYSSQGDCNSYALADLALDGTVSNVDLSGNFDFDGLGSDLSGTEMYGLDVVSSGKPDQHTDFIDSANDLIVSVDYPAVANPNDIIVIGTDLFALDHKNKQLYIIELDGANDLTSIDLQGNGNYSGLASRPIPEPATIALLGIGIAGLAGIGVRRKLKKKSVIVNKSQIRD